MNPITVNSNISIVMEVEIKCKKCSEKMKIRMRDANYRTVPNAIIDFNREGWRSDGDGNVFCKKCTKTIIK